LGSKNGFKRAAQSRARRYTEQCLYIAAYLLYEQIGFRQSE
jgi:hypothetical protein